MAQPVLILGIGNILLRDEGVGVHIVQEMQKMILPGGVEAVDGGTSGANLVEVVADRQLLIVVDAMNADEEPGTVYRFTAEDLMEQHERSISLHEFGLGETLIMARHLKCAPKESIIYGIQPGAIRPVGIGLTDEVAKVVPKIIQKLLVEAGAGLEKISAGGRRL